MESKPFLVIEDEKRSSRVTVTMTRARLMSAEVKTDYENLSLHVKKYTLHKYIPLYPAVEFKTFGIRYNRSFYMH